MENLKTPLYDRHLALGGKMVPFAGYIMPVQYPTGIKKEHMTVRHGVGLFDVSHMGELFIEGPESLQALNLLLSNRFDSMTDGRCRYAMILNEQGGIIDDLLVYRFHAERYLLVVNAANRDKDRDWLAAHLPEGVTLRDESDDWGQLALQGPLAEQVLRKLVGEAPLPEKNYTFLEEVQMLDRACVVSRTGYTGEDGFEIYLPKDTTGALWDALLQAGEEEGILPCGLGARDTLRLEASMPLYGHEMNEEVDPLTADLSFGLKMDKEAFIGKEALTDFVPTRRRVGLKMVGRGIAREGAEVQVDGKAVGIVTSGTMLPYLNHAYAMALVDMAYISPGSSVDVIIRGGGVAAEVVALPFYQREG